MLSSEAQMQIAALRAKPDLTLDDMRLAVRLLREGRATAATQSEGARRKVAKAEIKSADELLNELDGI